MAGSRLQCYEIGRTAHFERLNSSGASLMYRRGSYDCDASRAPVGHARRASRWQMFRNIRAASPQIVEVNEPLQLSAWLTTLVAIAAVKSIPRTRRPQLVTYAIENGNIGQALAHRARLPRKLTSAVVGVVGSCFLSALDRICFGTEGASLNYHTTLFLPKRYWPISTTKLALPSASASLSTRTPNSVLFVGSLESRKGISQLLDASDLLHRTRRVELRIVGDGPLRDEVKEFASGREWVTFDPKLPREDVISAYTTRKVLVLMSQRTPEWREQVGLPIVEALAAGMEIVTSSETGIAAWLAANGHRVLDPATSTEALAREIANALDDRRTGQAVVSPLPSKDGREVADGWLSAELDNS